MHTCLSCSTEFESKLDLVFHIRRDHRDFLDLGGLEVELIHTHGQEEEEEPEDDRPLGPPFQCLHGCLSMYGVSPLTRSTEDEMHLHLAATHDIWQPEHFIDYLAASHRDDNERLVHLERKLQGDTFAKQLESIVGAGDFLLECGA